MSEFYPGSESRSPSPAQRLLEAVPPEYSRWFGIDPDDAATIVVHDPTTGEPAPPDRVPDCWRLDPWCGLGLHTLDVLGRHNLLDMRVLLARHGSAADMQALIRSQGERFLESDVIGLETDYDPSILATHSPSSLQLQEAIRVPASDGHGGFVRTGLEWFNWHSTENASNVVVPYDIDSPEDGFRGELLALFDAQNQFAQAGREAQVDNLALDRLAAGAYQYLREWGLLGQFGYWLYRRLPQLPADRPVVATMIAGAWHDGIVDKAAAVHVNAQSTLIHTNEKSTQDELEVELWRTGRLRTT